MSILMYDHKHGLHGAFQSKHNMICLMNCQRRVGMGVMLEIELESLFTAVCLSDCHTVSWEVDEHLFYLELHHCTVSVSTAESC